MVVVLQPHGRVEDMRQSSDMAAIPPAPCTVRCAKIQWYRGHIAGLPQTNTNTRPASVSASKYTATLRLAPHTSSLVRQGRAVAPDASRLTETYFSDLGMSNLIVADVRFARDADTVSAPLGLREMQQIHR